MEYEKQEDGSLKPLPKKNVDFGGGLERLAAATQDTPDIFQIDVFTDTIKTLEKVSSKKYNQDEEVDRSFRVIADHVRAAVSLANEGVFPSNKEQGYVSRRLIRRAIRWAKMININSSFLKELISNKKISTVIEIEEEKFRRTLDKGLKELNKLETKHTISGKDLFFLYQSYGFPLEMAYEELTQNKKSNLKYDILLKDFNRAKKAHQNKSRSASVGMFKGGLADKSEDTIKLHTATHLLHASLRKVVGDHVQQIGSNITADRLRFDFKHPEKLTALQIKKVETLINEKIKENLPVKKTIQSKDKALKSGALAFFRETYPDKVSVYTIGDFSKELCGGPHVNSTGKIGTVRIKKEESIGGGQRRIYAVLKK